MFRKVKSLILFVIIFFTCGTSHLQANTLHVIHNNGPRVIDTTRKPAEPSSIEQFFSKVGKDYREKEDQKQISNILKEYQQNREKSNAWEDAQIKLQLSNISPARKAEVKDFLHSIRSN